MLELRGKRKGFILPFFFSRGGIDSSDRRETEKEEEEGVKDDDYRPWASLLLLPPLFECVFEFGSASATEDEDEERVEKRRGRYSVWFAAV